MSVLDEAARLNAAGQQQAAVQLIERAAEAGDVEALFALANWRLFGLFGGRDIAAAHSLLDRAAALGSVEAVRTKAILTANGTGCPADSAAAENMLLNIRDRDPHAALQVDFLAGMAPPAEYSPDRARTLAEAPMVKLYSGLLTARECAYLTAMAESNLTPSFVTNPQTGARMPHPIRTSMGMSFGPTQEDLVIRRINERIAKASNTDVACGEPLHMLRYTPGQEYKPHTDSMPGEVNQREWTVLVYLNDGYEGGATRFSRLDLEVRGAPGDALIFRNVTDDGRPDPNSLHAGLPVTAGAKRLATRWIRTRPYHPWTD
jgi:prolyl 4-hydroxylase